MWTLAHIDLTNTSLTLEASTVPHFWLPNGGPQLTSGDQRCVSESHSRSELSVSTLATIGLANTSLTPCASTDAKC